MLWTTEHRSVVGRASKPISLATGFSHVTTKGAGVGEPFQRFTVKRLKRLVCSGYQFVTALKCGANENFKLERLLAHAVGSAASIRYSVLSLMMGQPR